MAPMAWIETSLSAEALDVAAAIEKAGVEEAGGIGAFVGTVRVDSSVTGNEGKEVTALEYEAHPDLAEATMAEIASATVARFHLFTFIAGHRTGACALGEPTVVVACGAAHRAEALEACRHAIDEIKARVPIWKKEVYADGSAWVGTGS